MVVFNLLEFILYSVQLLENLIKFFQKIFGIKSRQEKTPEYYALRDAQWEKIKPFLPGKEGNQEKYRLFVNAVLYHHRAKISWEDLPLHFGSFKSTHKRFDRWDKKGVWNTIFQILVEDHDNEHVAIDSLSLKAMTNNSTDNVIN